MNDTEYRFTVWPLTEKGGSARLVRYSDLPRCMSEGELIEEASANAEDAKYCSIIAAMKQAGRSIPLPLAAPDEGHSGKWHLRAPEIASSTPRRARQARARQPQDPRHHAAG